MHKRSVYQMIPLRSGFKGFGAFHGNEALKNSACRFEWRHKGGAQIVLVAEAKQLPVQHNTLRKQ